jgi:hypothetical protein
MLILIIQTKDLIAGLINKGTNPNCISTVSFKNLLDWIEWGRHLEKTKEKQWIDAMDNIIDLLKRHGAKFYGELFHEKNKK